MKHDPVGRRSAHPLKASAISASILGAALAILVGAGAERAAAQANDEAVTAHGVTPKLELTPAQRDAIYQQVRKDKSKVAPSRFATHVGADVPPMIELYMLPDEILANNPDTKLYKFTRVDDQVVLVDPVKMRVVAVIGPKQKD